MRTNFSWFFLRNARPNSDNRNEINWFQPRALRSPPAWLSDTYGTLGYQPPLPHCGPEILLQQSPHCTRYLMQTMVVAIHQRLTPYSNGPCVVRTACSATINVRSSSE